MRHVHATANLCQNAMRALRHAGLWQAEFAAGLVDVATGALLAIRLGELVVQLIKSHLGNYQQAQLLQQYVEIIVPEVRRLEQHVRTQAAPAANQVQPIIRAIQLVGLAHKVWCLFAGMRVQGGRGVALSRKDYALSLRSANPPRCRLHGCC